MFRARSSLITSRKDVLLRMSGLRKASDKPSQSPKQTVDVPADSNQVTAARGMKRTRRFLWRLVGATVLGYAGVGAVVSASWYSKSFREFIERNVPYSAEFIAAALYTYLPPPPYESKELTFRDVLLHDDDEKQESSGSSNTKTDSVVATNETHDLPVPATPSQLPSAPEPVMPSQLPSATDYMKQHQEEEVLLKQRERDAALEAFADRVTRAKQQFIKEVDSIKLGKEKLTEDDQNMLLVHAHRRIEQLERQLTNHQTAERHRVVDAVERQRQEYSRLRDERVDLEKHSLRDLLSAEKQKWELDARVDFESDLRRELSRQSAAHSDHLTSVLRQQEHELDTRYKTELHFVLMSQTDAFRAYLAHSVARLRAIDVALAGRAEQEQRSLKVRQLWVACQALLAAVVNGNSDAASPVKPLSAEVSAVMQAADNHPFVKQVVSSLPAEALERGVYSEEKLIERFATVQRVCRRVAMVDERGGSLPRYLLSYIQSLFVFSRPSRAALDKSAREGEVDSDDILVDVKALTTFDIVDEAQNALRAGRLDLAVRLVNQLRGEPRRVASDWINDARLLLEARQASHALLAFSAATGAGATY